MNRNTRNIVLSLFFAIFMTTLVLMAVKAHADPTPAPKHLYVARIAATGPVGSGAPLRVTLSNGDRDVLKPCRYEDGRHCYWNAGNMGNGIGHSFIVTRGHIFYVDLRGL